MSVSNLLAPAADIFAHHPWLAILAFCVLHLTASTTGIPGSCTLLNTLSGAVFGFWRGCAIVYPVTALSAALMYKFGARLTFEKVPASFSSLLRNKEKEAGTFLFLVGLRLSPLLPFGVLNALMGLSGVPFGVFMLTTVVGVFFDVTLLNAVGASVHANVPSDRMLAAAFAVVFAGVYFARIRLAKVLRP